MKSRKGFVKAALQTGSSLVPIYLLGSTQLFQVATGPVGDFFQRVSRAFKASIIPFHGRYGTLIPYPHPLAVLVGTPIDVVQIDNPTQQQVRCSGV
jgi:2-acylglycerol O-acyltransferase 2